MPDAASPGTFIVRFLNSGGKTAGVGVLVSSRHIVTCAHVVNTALGHDQRSQPRPDGPVTVEFPLLPGPASPMPGTVAVWFPPSINDIGGDDIAGIVLDRDPPEGAIPARLSTEAAAPGLRVSMFGYPEKPRRPDGAWVSASVRGTVGNGRLQLDSGPDSALRVQPGFSGGPVYGDAAGKVVGILSNAPSAGAPERDSRAISADRIRGAWTEVLSGHWQSAAARRRNRESAELTILHLSAPRFTGDDEEAEQSLFSPLHHDLAYLSERPGIRPDLLVVTGDLTERGRPSEFRQAGRFLDALAEAVEIPRRHVAIVPGRHDVNRRACAAYFSEAEADEREPTAPYWPKWRHYAAALGDFYDGTPAADHFTPDEPFTLFEMPDLNVVVAGLNSTIADSHRESDHRGYLGESQLEWFRARLEDYQRRGWLRIAAVYHGNPDDAQDVDRTLGDPKLTHLFLHDGGPGTGYLPSGSIALAARAGAYQMITVAPDSVSRHARRYDADEGHWTGDTGITSDGSDWHVRVPYQLADVQEVFPSSESRDGHAPPDSPGGLPGEDRPVRRGEFLERVAEATRARFPRAVVAERPSENYLRVCVAREGGGTEQWPVGVIDGPPTEETIDGFADGVHAQFASYDPALRSELVYGAPAAPSGLTERARRRGVRLKSLVEYQGLLDLTRLAEAQRERLSADRVYPGRLYVEQRYRVVHGSGHGDEIQTGLLSQAVSWLGAEHARLVLVLGDFGRGKTAFLRQLTRVLPDELPSVTPVLVELRGLEKGPTLDDLLGQYLIRQGIEDFSSAKLRYMIESGRVALLFDGFDELELRVGYESATEYLRALISSVSPTGQAKVILTSRTQHFRSTDQVLTALGKKVESRASSRVVVLEDFSDGQMTEFLTRLYHGDERLARERLDLARGIGNLLDLAHNPRMLSFIASLDSGRLRAAMDDSGQVNAGGLYEQIIDSWLETETSRQHHRHGLRTITKEERFAACTALALRLWQSKDPRLALADLSAEVMNTLSDLAERGYTEDQAAHAIASGSLLVRGEDGTFSFIHQSVMEWLVAKAAVNDREILSRAQASRLMAAFVTDIAGADTVSDWAGDILASPSGPDASRKNAYALVREPSDAVARRRPVDPSGGPRPHGVRLTGLDLRGEDLSQRNLRHGDLRGTDLRGMRLDNVDLAGADLRDADLTGVTMTRGSLRDAVLPGSKWDRAAILGTSGLTAASQNPELAAAAIPGRRDPAEVMFVPPGDCSDVVFSPDGSLLAVARGHTVQLVDTGGDTILRMLRGHTRAVTSVAFSADGSLLATASRDNTARLWDVSTGTERGTLEGHDGWVSSVAFSPDSRLVATASRDCTARIWGTATGAVAATLTGHTAPVTMVAFSPDGSALATASSDATARTWHVASGTARDTLSGHGRTVTAVAFSPDSTLLATGSDDRTARIWDAATGTERSTIAEYPQPVSAIAFSPDGTLLATSHGARAETLDTASGIRQATFREHYLRVTGVAFSPDGTLLATSSMDGAHIWSLESGAQRASFTHSTAPVTAVAFSPDGTTLAAANDIGDLHSWDTRTGTPRASFTKAHSRPVTTVVFSPDQALLATASRDGTIRVWEAATGAQHSRQRRNDPATIAFSPDGTQLTAASPDGSVRIWNVRSQVGVTPHDLGPATAMAFSYDGTYLATASGDGISVIREVSSWREGSPVSTHSGFAGTVRSIAVSPDGALLAVASPSGTVHVWDTAPGNEIAALRGHTRAVNSVAFSHDGTLVATGSDDGTARIWDAAAGEERAVLAGHADSVRAVTFSADGALVATGSSDGTARIWDAGSGQEIAALISLPSGGYATLLPDGGYKLSDDADDIWWAVKLCRFGPSELDPYVPGLRRLAPDDPVR